MNEDAKEICRRELRSYYSMKDLTKYALQSNSLKPELLVLIYQKIMIIENIYATLSPSAKDYVKYRYFEQNEVPISEYADLFNCDDRTIRRWDADLRKRLYEDLQILGCYLLIPDPNFPSVS